MVDPILIYIFKAIAGAIGIIFVGAVGYLYARIGKREDKTSAAELAKVAAALKIVEDEKAKLFTERTKLAEAVVSGEYRIVQLEKDMAVMKAEAVPINAAYHAMLISGLRHHHVPELDVILDKMMSPEQLTKKEIADRNVYLKQRELNPSFSEAERLKAKILPDVDRLMEIEQEEGIFDPLVETVLISQPEQKDVIAPDGSVQKEDRKDSESNGG